MADSGDCTVGVTVKVIGILEVPPDIITTTSADPEDSEPLNCEDANSRTNSEIKHILMKFSLYHNILTSRVTGYSYCSIPSTICCYCWTK